MIREVEVVTLSTLRSELKTGTTPALIKLDMEGVEVEALKAAPSEWLTADEPLWVVECHPEAQARFGTAVAEILPMFPARYFELWMIGKYAEPDGLDLPPKRWDDDALTAASFYNLVAVPLGGNRRQRRQDLQSILPGLECL